MDEDRTALGRRGLVVPAPEAPIEVLRDLEFAGASGRPLRLDVHRPAHASTPAPAPLVWIASGYRDEGFAAAVGCPFKEMEWTKSWARLFAAAGMAAIAATNEDPAADLRAGLEAVSRRGEELGVDAGRVGIFATSGHAPTALSALMRDFPFDVSSAAFAYGYTLDLPGSDAVARAAESFRFANPCAGRSIEELRTDVPLLLVRAGRDEMPGLNASLDAFAAGALRRNLPLTILNHPEAPHAFDLFHDDARSRSIIREIVRFLARRSGYSEETGRPLRPGVHG